MDPNTSLSNWVEVNLGAIKNNVELLCQLTNVQVMAVVKANAYGHGLVPVAHAALEGGASWFGVARIEEAVELRHAGLTNPILVLGYTPKSKYETAISNDISLAVWEMQQISHASVVTKKIGKSAKLHLKIDTGMARLGVSPLDAVALAKRISSLDFIIFEGVFTHFARADEEETSYSDFQEEAFKDLLNQLARVNAYPHVIHAANSAASLNRPSSYFDLVRTGIAIYGLHPSLSCRLPTGFQPALAWKSIISQVKTVGAGQGVSYGHKYVTTKPERIGTIPVGYADGYRLWKGNQVLVGGCRVPVVGRVCMDQILVNLDNVPEAKADDCVVLIGAQENEVITVEEVASWWGTINYEVVCGLSSRVPRIYS